MKIKLSLLILLVVGLSVQLSANPINGLLERIDKGASKKFVIEFKKGADDFFELDQKGTKVVVRGNNYVNIATGINWYLKYYAGIQLSWNGMQAKLPQALPPVPGKSVTKHPSHSVTILTTVPIPTPWPFGIGNAGRKK